jgi:GR25 family glycosyltransferase involved in LPS biosynthesis
MYKLANPADRLADRLLQYNQLCNILPVTGLAEFSTCSSEEQPEAVHVPVSYHQEVISPKLLEILRAFIERQKSPADLDGCKKIMIVHDRRNPLPEAKVAAIVQHFRPVSTVIHLASSGDIKIAGAIPYVNDYTLMGMLGVAEHIVYTDSILAYMTALAMGKVAACPLFDLPGRHLPVIKNWPRFHHLWSYSVYFEAVYFINLDRRDDRRAKIESMLAKRFSMTARRVAAMDGRNIRWDASKMGPITRYWNNGALGCVLSHREAILDAIRRDYEQVLILEDDADISEQFFDTMAKIVLPVDWHMIYLSANLSEPVKDKVQDNLYRLRGGLGAHAIIWHRRAFEQCLQFLSGPYAPWDMFLSYYQHFFPCYIMNPGMAVPVASMSDIIGQHVNYAEQINYADPLNPRGKIAPR